VSVGLYESRVAEEHWADSGAGVLGLILEEDVIAIGEHDEEAVFSEPGLESEEWSPTRHCHAVEVLSACLRDAERSVHVAGSPQMAH